MNKLILGLFKIWRNIVYAVFAVIVTAFLLILILENINYRPLKIKSIDYAEKVEISLTFIEDSISYDLEITDKDEIIKLNNEISKIRAKKIINGGGGDGKFVIYIEIYYRENYDGEKLEDCTIYGNHIFFNEGKDVYRINENDSEIVLEYFSQLCKSGT